MTENPDDKKDEIDEAEALLKKQLEAIRWPIEYGSVRIQIRAGRATLVTIERTIKLDGDQT